jgi:hypothetical protein
VGEEQPPEAQGPPTHQLSASEDEGEQEEGELEGKILIYPLKTLSPKTSLCAVDRSDAESLTSDQEHGQDEDDAAHTDDAAQTDDANTTDDDGSDDASEEDDDVLDAGHHAQAGRSSSEEEAEEENLYKKPTVVKNGRQGKNLQRSQKSKNSPCLSNPPLDSKSKGLRAGGAGPGQERGEDQEVEGHHGKKPKVAKATKVGKHHCPITDVKTHDLTKSPYFPEHGNAGGAGPITTGGETDGASGRGDGKLPTAKQTNKNGNAGGAVPENKNAESDGKNLKKKYTYLPSNQTNLKEKNTYLSHLTNLEERTHTYQHSPYLPDLCPTPEATQTERAVWAKEMRELRPFLLEKHASKPDGMQLLMVQADLDKAAGKIVPRFRLEMVASDKDEEAAKSLADLEDRLAKARQAEEEEDEAIDDAEAALHAAKDLILDLEKLAKDLGEARYRMPDPIHEGIQTRTREFAKASKGIARLRTTSTSAAAGGPEEGARALKVRQYISSEFSGEGQLPKRDFAQWRNEWREAEKAMKARKGTVGDFYNRLLAALDGKAKETAREYRDRTDPYKEAMKRLANDFGDDIRLSQEYLKTLQDPKKAVRAAEGAWDRFKAMEKPLKAVGVSLRDILWHQASLRMLPASLDAEKRWEAWVEKQRRHFSQNQAASGGTESKGKHPIQCRDPAMSQAFRSTAAAVVQKTEDIAGSPMPLANLKEKVPNTYPTYLSDFHHSVCFRPAEIARFFREMGRT